MDAPPGNRADHATPGGFVGGTTDPATSLTNLGAREYNPATESFVSPDPLQAQYDPQDLNPYAYAADNPATNSDPTGLMYAAPPGGGVCPSNTPGCPGYHAPVSVYANLPDVNWGNLSGVSHLSGLSDTVPCGDGHTCYASPYGKLTWASWTKGINIAAAAATALALVTAEVPVVDVATGGLAVAADTLAGLTGFVNSGLSVLHHRYWAAVGYALGAAFSLTGAGIGGAAVSTAISESAALSTATRAGGAFGILDHALPEGAPELAPAALAYMDSLGAWQGLAPRAALWGEAALAMSANEGIAVGIEWLWNRSQ